MNKLLLIGVAAVSLMAPFAYGEIIYTNDFSTRKSVGAIPYGSWREVLYSTGAFLNDNNDAPFDGSVFQDNWIRGRNSCTCPCRIVDDNGNPEVVMYNATDNNKHVVIKHRIGNTFTSGTVTAQCDFRAPTSWTGYSLIQDFILGDERFFSPETDPTNGGGVYLNYRAARGGVVHDGGSRKFTVLESSGSVKENTILANTLSWYRIVISVNLDTRKYSCTFYDLGTAHPTLDTPTPETAVFSRSGVNIVNEAVTSISAIGLDCYSPHGGSDPANLDLANTGQFDNIRVSHNGTECYVNDFTSRRSRGLYGTMVGTYTTDCLVTNRVESEVYNLNTDLLPDRENSGSTVQTPGIDGWRRTGNNNGCANAQVRADGGNVYLRVEEYPYRDKGDTERKFGFFAHPFGSMVTSGKVRISVDARIPSSSTWASDSILYVTLGNDQYYNAKPADANNYRFAAVGIRGSNNNPTYVAPSGTQNPSATDPISTTHWYRLVLTADLDAGTSEYKLYEQGTTSPSASTANGTLIYTSPTIGRLKDITSISCFSLGAYFSPVYFDNVRVWRVDGADETLLYENFFSSRTFYHQNIRESKLVGTVVNEPVGQDGWTRANIGVMKAVVRDNGGNQSLTFGDGNGSLAYAVHDIGTLHKSGRLTTQVDACPPSGWRGGSRSTYFWLGGDKFHEGNLKNNDETFPKWAALSFGFHDAAGATDAGGVYTNVTLCAYNGNGTGSGSLVDSDVVVDPTHWYRFVVKTSLDDGTSDIAVYDMGTEHPTFASDRPAEPVATFAGMRFRRAAVNLGGVSSLGISAMGTMDNTINGTTGVYWDNIYIRYSGGFIISIR